MSARKLLGSNRIKARVALASVTVLVAGWLVAPRSGRTPLATPEERPAPLLDEQAQTRQVARPFDGIQQVRPLIADVVVSIPAPEPPLSRRTTVDYQVPLHGPVAPSGYGVVINPRGDVLTHANALRGRTTVQLELGPGVVTPATIAAYEPESGLVVLQTPEPSIALRTPVYAETLAEAGALATAFFRIGDDESMAPVFITGVSPGGYAIATGAALRPGTPIYNLSGELLAIATGPGDPPIALNAQHAATRLLQSIEAGVGRRASLGVTFQPLSDALTSVFGSTGALVADVVPGGPAELAGLVAGDVLVAIDDTLVTSPEAAHQTIAQLPVGSAHSLRIERGERTMTLDVTAAGAFETAARARRAPSITPEGTPMTHDVFAEASLAAAGVPRDAVIVSINTRAVNTRAAALRELRRARPPFLLYLQAASGERFFAVVDRRP